MKSPGYGRFPSQSQQRLEDIGAAGSAKLHDQVKKWVDKKIGEPAEVFAEGWRDREVKPSRAGGSVAPKGRKRKIRKNFI